MGIQPTSFTVKEILEETPQMRLLSLNATQIWKFIPGQIAVLGIEGLGESYFAIASAPEEQEKLDFLIRDGKGVAGALFRLNKGNTAQGKGPLGKGFPIDNYRKRDFLLAAVGSAISPMRSVIRSICFRRQDFGNVTLVYGVRYSRDLPLVNEIEAWKKSGITIILTLSHPEESNWTGKSGYVFLHFKEALNQLHNPIALICGMKAMMEQSRNELIRQGIDSEDILSNY